MCWVGPQVEYQGETYDFGKPFARMTVKESILHFNPDIAAADLDDLAVGIGAMPDVWVST